MVRSLVIALAIGYLSGSLPWGLWLSRWLRGVDIRSVGSKNIGATNVYRELGPAVGVPVLILDILKGLLPVALVPGLTITAQFPGGFEWCRIAVGLAAVAGHVWTCFAAFRGGKGVATAAGVLLALAPQAFAASAIVFIATVSISRFISLGSILAAITFPMAFAMFNDGAQRPTFLLGVIIAGIVILTHRENIARLTRGEERRFSLRKGSRT